jgi:hypothetical protein
MINIRELINAITNEHVLELKSREFVNLLITGVILFGNIYYLLFIS